MRVSKRKAFRAENNNWYHRDMWKRLIPATLFVAYSALLIKVLVFKDIPLIRIGHLMINFGGTNPSGEANLVPFKTILPYMLGYKGLMIAGINLVGNIVPLIPIGFLAPFIYRTLTWKKSLALAVVTGLVLEGMQVVFRVGIFDIDDLLLNGLGVVIGYGAYRICALIRARIFKKPDSGSDTVPV